MIVFWITAAAMLLLALSFALTPLLRDKPAAGVDANALNLSVIKQQLSELKVDLANGNLEQAQYDAARRDLEKELLRDMGTAEPDAAKPRSGIWAVAVVAAGVPLLAVGMYQSLGQQEIIAQLEAQGDLQPQVASTGNRPHADQSGTPLPPMDELVKGLAAKLEQNPDNLPGWLMLGRSYVSLNQPDGALYAYERAYKLAPENPDVLLGYAQALVKSGREELTGRPAKLISEAHERAPQNQTALWMMGLVSFEHQDFAQTVSYWQQLAAQIPAESQEHQQLAEYIEQARSRMAPGSTPTPAGPQPSPAVAETQTAQSVASPTGPEAAGQPAAPAGAALTVKVSLDPALADQVQPEDRVFVFARAVSGPPMPLAAVSKQVRDLPLQLTLDDSMAMMPQMKLSAFPEVLVGARISKTGNAMPQSGDLQGEVSPVNSGQAAVVQVVINSIRP